MVYVRHEFLFKHAILIANLGITFLSYVYMGQKLIDEVLIDVLKQFNG